MRVSSDWSRNSVPLNSIVGILESEDLQQPALWLIVVYLTQYYKRPALYLVPLPA